MAKVTMVFQDVKDGSVNITVTFDPALQKGVKGTRAQAMVLLLCGAVGELPEDTLEYGDKEDEEAANADKS